MPQPLDAGTRSPGNAIRTLMLGSFLAMSLTALGGHADAARVSPKPHGTQAAAPAKPPLHHVTLRVAADNTPTRNAHRAVFIRRPADNTPTAKLGSGSKLTKNGKARLYASRRGGGLQCVPFARAASGIELKGNAVNWWDAAAGVYARGNDPEVGAVLNFRANGSMRLGHVAVVREVVNSREIEIDHANWAWAGKNNISRGVAVVDVSDRNDWTAVRVSLGHGEQFGSIYGTYGFIYDRADNGVMVASVHHRHLGAPVRDVVGYDEVAESPRQTAAVNDDAPARSLR
jgi:surface antigen